MRDSWSEAEDAILLKYIDPLATSIWDNVFRQLSDTVLPGRTVSAIQTRLQRLRKASGVNAKISKWTPELDVLAVASANKIWSDVEHLFPGITMAQANNRRKLLKRKEKAKLAKETKETWDTEPVMFPGKIKCLSCPRVFKSWCMRRNRICENCVISSEDIVLGQVVAHVRIS